MDKTARQGLANSAGPGGVRRSSSGRLLTEPDSRRHHGGARTFMRTAGLDAFLVVLLIGTLLAGVYLWLSLSGVAICGSHGRGVGKVCASRLCSWGSACHKKKKPK